MKAGFAKIEITPPLGFNLNGYYNERLATHIIEPLYATCVAYSDGDTTALTISLDISEILQKDTNDIRSRVSARTGVPFEAIFVACIHTHTAPVISEIPGFFKRDAAYYEMFCAKICDAATLAIADMKEASAFIARGEAKGVSFSRRFRMKDGSIRTNPPRAMREEIADVIGEPDDTVQLVKLKREGAADIAIVNFGTHPDVLGGKGICPDWPAYLRNTLEAALADEADGKGVKVVFFNGAQGDMVHLDQRLELRRFGVEQSRHMGRALAGAVLAVYTFAEPINSEKVFFKQNMARVGLNKGTDEQVAVAKEIDKRFLNNEDISDAAFNIVMARRYIRLENEPKEVDLNIVCVGFGDVAFAGFPGEPFCCIGKDLKEQSPFAMTIPCCNANGSEGYIVPDEALLSDGYESSSSLFLPGVASEMFSVALRTLNEIKAEL